MTMNTSKRIKARRPLKMLILWILNINVKGLRIVIFTRGFGKNLARDENNVK